MTLIVDPFDEDIATDEDGELLRSVRMLPIDDDGIVPTVEELSQAPIGGYSQGLNCDRLS